MSRAEYPDKRKYPELILTDFKLIPDVDKYEGNEREKVEEYQVQDAGNLMSIGRNVRAFLPVSAIRQVTGGSEEVDLIRVNQS